MQQEQRDIFRRKGPEIIDKLGACMDVVSLLEASDPIVLTDSMAEEIEAERTPRDKTRKLLATLTYRGPNAFDEFYIALCKTNNGHVADLLKPDKKEDRIKKYGTRKSVPSVTTHSSEIRTNIVTNPDEDQLDVTNRQHEVEWPTEECMEDYYDRNIELIFEEVKHKTPLRKMDIYSRNVYPLAAEDKGTAVIIANKYNGIPSFEDDKQNYDLNVYSLQRFFKLLGYNVAKPIKDLPKQDLDVELRKIMNNTKYVSTTTKSFIVFVISYGKSDGFYCGDKRVMHFSELKNIVSNCTSLEGKPKLFFIQSIRTDDDLAAEGYQVSSDSAQAQKTKESDQYLFECWLSDNVWKRRRGKMQLFLVQALVHTVVCHGLTYELPDIIRYVKKYIGDLITLCSMTCSDDEIKHGFSEDGSLSRKFYFFPYEVNKDSFEDSPANMFSLDSM